MLWNIKKHKEELTLIQLIDYIKKKGCWVRHNGCLYKTKPTELFIEVSSDFGYIIYIQSDKLQTSYTLGWSTYKVRWALTKKGLTSL